MHPPVKETDRHKHDHGREIANPTSLVSPGTLARGGCRGRGRLHVTRSSGPAGGTTVVGRSPPTGRIPVHRAIGAGGIGGTPAGGARCRRGPPSNGVGSGASAAPGPGTVHP